MNVIQTFEFETEWRAHGTPAIRSSNLFHITVNQQNK
jgi:hypothetical protein